MGREIKLKRSVYINETPNHPASRRHSRYQPPYVESLKALARVFGVTIDELVVGAEEAPEKRTTA